jgi:hypothetical protein
MNAMNPEPSGTRMSTEEMKAVLRNHFEVKCSMAMHSLFSEGAPRPRAHKSPYKQRSICLGAK